MQRTFSASILVFLSLAVSAAHAQAPQPAAPQASAAAPTVDEIVAKNLQAKGGAEK